MSDNFPASEISLRSTSPHNILLQAAIGEKRIIIGEVDRASASWMVHPEAIYLHQGESFLVEDIDFDSNLAQLLPVDVDYYTRPQRETEIQLLELSKQRTDSKSHISYGELLVTSKVVGYKKVRWETNENLGYGEVTLPPTQLQTTGYWLSLTEQTVSELQSEGTWNNSRNDYGSNWQTQRVAARTRDQFCCQFCGLPETDKAHHVHHIVPLRSFSSPEIANRLTNLVTLCPNCHLRAESSVRVRSGLSGLAYALENIAPVFLMCDRSDLGVHVDPQSPLSNGSPTIVLYDSIPAGIGFSERLFEIHEELLINARDVVSACGCSDGCPSCVGPGGEDGSGGKKEAMAILMKLTKN